MLLRPNQPIDLFQLPIDGSFPILSAVVLCMPPLLRLFLDMMHGRYLVQVPTPADDRVEKPNGPVIVNDDWIICHLNPLIYIYCRFKQRKRKGKMCICDINLDSG